jgi:hypothetical protein
MRDEETMPLEEQEGGDKMSGGHEVYVEGPEHPWIVIRPPFCLWAIIHNLETPIVVKLEKGEAQLRDDGVVYPMVVGAQIHCQGLVEVHNTQPKGRPPGEETEIWYWHLE